MIDAWPLFAVMGLFYILEGLWWTPSEAVCFSRGLWGQFTCSTPLLVRRDAHHGFILPRHLIANGDRFLTCAWTLSISPDGMGLREWSPAKGLSGRDPSPLRFIPFEGVEALAMVGSRLLHKGKTIANTTSPTAANELLRLLRELENSDSEHRGRRIIETIDRALDHDDARRRMRKMRWILRRVKLVPLLLIANLFVLAPTFVTLFGLSIWPLPVALHSALSILAVVIFRRAATMLPPRRQEDRFAIVLMLLFFPPSTARYAELLSRDLLSGLHPLAVAAAVLDREAFKNLARDELVELQNDKVDNDVIVSQSYSVENWFRRTFEKRMLKALERYGLSLEELHQPPCPEAGAVTYCPRCHAQYRSGFQECIDCDGIDLIPHLVKSESKR